MSGLCGWFNGELSASAGPQAIAAMAAPLNRLDASAVRSASADFGAVAVAGSDADVLQGSERIVAVWGTVRFADPDLDALARRQGVAHALSLGYDRRGSGILATVSGAFSLAILDRRSGEAMLATDRMGARPICYSLVAGKLVFGSTLDSISAFPGTLARIDRQAIYDYIYFHMVPAPRTIHAGSLRLLPGTLL